jgi:hypothetical protein
VQVEIQKSIIAKGIIRFFSLYKRIESLDSCLIQELTDLVNSYKEIEIVSIKAQEISDLKMKKLTSSKEIIQKGLDDGNLQDIIAGLTVFYNFQVVKEEIIDILQDSLKKIREFISSGLQQQANVSSGLQQQANGKIKELWKNVGQMTEEILKECNKINNLEKGLEAVGMECNQDVVGPLKEELGLSIGVYFWNNFALVLEKGIRSAIKGNNFFSFFFFFLFFSFLFFFHVFSFFLFSCFFLLS